MKLFSKKNISDRTFLDYASTTPILKEVKSEMQKYLTDNFYNPSAIYKEGVFLRDQLINYRKEVAKILHASYKDVVFTSGGTESNNQVIFGIFEAVKDKIDKPHFLISSIEHSSLIEAAKEIERRGGEVELVSVNEDGKINPQEIKNKIKTSTVLVSVMLVNNEIGTIEPIGSISRIIREFRRKNNSDFPYFHSDASQGANYLTLDLTSLGVDLLTLDGSKIYGPKGIGVLISRPNVEIKPLIYGGGQERGMRSGTESLFLISGFAKALEVAQKDKEKEYKRLEILKELFISSITKNFPNIIINTPKESIPNVISISIPNQIGEFIAIKLDQEGILVSTGSSCGIYKDIAGSLTIKSIGKEDLAESTIRFSFGRFTTEKDIKKAISALKKILF